ncbi:acyl-CoA dehydrogenase [Bradyrhizobium sp. i1.3.6]
MDFTMSVKQKKWLDRVQSFVTEHVRPAVPVYEQQDAAGDRWKLIPVVEDLKMKARAKGLWNMFLPPSSHEDRELRGAGLSNLEYAPLAEEMGRIGWASEVFNCSAPDTGNMEVLIRYGTEAQKQQWLKPLMNGEIRSAFLMTEPAVASSDATNIETRIERDGNHYIVNGRKWWSSGVGDPRCMITIVMGKTDSNAPRHQQQSQILVPLATPGIKIEKMLPVFGYDDAPHGHGQVLLENVRVPASNLLLGEGRGFEIAQGRLGPGRIHHCMRTIGKAEEALEKMINRLNSRVAFGKKIVEYSVWEQRIAEAAHRY